jgi:glycosyltransferase involved in cell wall biosynthesis
MSVDIIAALRVKNESRWIAEVLQAVSWCKKIYLMDDHSTDGTREIARESGAIVYESPFAGLDEARDKEWLLGQISKEQPVGTWVLLIDGDEVLAPDGQEKIRLAIESTPSAIAFSLRILYLWNSRDQIRVDGVYGKFARPSLFMLGRSLSFRRTEQAGHLHCSSVPAAYIGRCLPCPAALLHLGYMDSVDRIRKWKYYNLIDGHNRTEGYEQSHPERGAYPHIVQGDTPEVPGHLTLLHAGPLELRPL